MLSGIGGTGFTYIIKKLTSRPHYSQKYMETLKHNRVCMLKDFNAREVVFVTEDGIRLQGLCIERRHAQRTLLLCHGWRMAKESLLPFLHMFPHDNIVLFDFRSHGQSGGDCITFGFDERKDVNAVVDWILAHETISKLPLYGIGISMGAVSLFGVAVQRPIFAAIVLDSPFGSFFERAKKMLNTWYRLPEYTVEKLGVTLFEYYMKFSPHDINPLLWAANQGDTPVLLIHSMQDHIAPLLEVEKLYELLPGKKDFWKVNGSAHARIFEDLPEEYAVCIEAFFKQYRALHVA